MNRRRTSLATRIALLAVGVVAVTGVVAGTLATSLIRSAGTSSARHTLQQLADVSQTVADNPKGAGLARIRRALQGLQVRSGRITDAGRVVSSSPLVSKVLRPADIAAVLAGQNVSTTRAVNGVTVLVEARPTADGGVVVVQRRSDAVAQTERAVRRLIAALLIAGGVALVLGLLVAWRLARPLRRTAAAARALAAGQRDVAVPVAGPTEVAEVSSAINALAAALGHSEARQREFLLSVSHDLRTPLTAISAYAESLADGTIPAENAREAGAIVLAEARRLDRLVADLLDLARLDARDLRIELAPADLTSMAADAARVWRGRCGTEGVVFRDELAGGPVVALTDASRVRQVLDGLFDNALRVTPAGAPIVLCVRTEPGVAVAEIRDGGPGLTDADLAVAFEQGVLNERYRGVREVGSGLGLAIVARLVARLGATIEAGHAAEGGARFTVRLPLASS